MTLFKILYSFNQTVVLSRNLSFYAFTKTKLSFFSDFISTVAWYKAKILANAIVSSGIQKAYFGEFLNA